MLFTLEKLTEFIKKPNLLKKRTTSESVWSVP